MGIAITLFMVNDKIVYYVVFGKPYPITNRNMHCDIPRCDVLVRFASTIRVKVIPRFSIFLLNRLLQMDQLLILRKTLNKITGICI